MLVSENDPAAHLFPLSDSGETEQVEALRMGYEDLSGGVATRLLETLPSECVDAIHKFTFDGPTSVIGLVSHVSGLLEGLDTVDPERASQQAHDEAKTELERGKTLVQAFRDNPLLPFLGRLRSPDDLSDDAARVGWGVVNTADEYTDAVTYLATFDLMNKYLTDPSSNRQAYDEAMLAFINDVIFRPGVSFNRG